MTVDGRPLVYRMSMPFAMPTAWSGSRSKPFPTVPLQEVAGQTRIRYPALPERKCRSLCRPVPKKRITKPPRPLACPKDVLWRSLTGEYGHHLFRGGRALQRGVGENQHQLYPAYRRGSL